jgi:hypothetical protein
VALTDTFVRQVKYSGKPSGDKYTDGSGLFLLVNAAGKYWRLNYRYAAKQKTLALGVYPSISLAVARKRRDDARECLATGIDPATAKRNDKLALVDAAANTFEVVAREWLSKTKGSRAETTQDRVTRWLERKVFPNIGTAPISTLGPRDVLLVAQKLEAHGHNESAHRIMQICGQVFRYAAASGLAGRDVTVDLKGALAPKQVTSYAAITEPTQLAPLLRAIDCYSGHPYATAALKLTPLVFVRPGELRAAEWNEFDLDASEWRIAGLAFYCIAPLQSPYVETMVCTFADRNGVSNQFDLESDMTKIKKILEGSDQAQLQGYFARVNWNAHFVPIAISALAEFKEELSHHNWDRVDWWVLSEDAAKGHYAKAKNEVWGDSISVSLGAARSLSPTAIIKVSGRNRLLVENQASLTFFQSVSGTVVAIIRPPTSEVAQPLKVAYVVDSWKNPGTATHKQIRKVLELLLEVDLYCSAATLTDSKGIKTLAKLQVKDAVLSRGGSRLWVRLMYVYKIVRYILKIHGMGTPIPPTSSLSPID